MTPGRLGVGVALVVAAMLPGETPPPEGATPPPVPGPSPVASSSWRAAPATTLAPTTTRPPAPVASTTTTRATTTTTRPPSLDEQCRQVLADVTRRLPVPPGTYVTCPATDAQTTNPVTGERHDGYAWWYTPPHPSWVYVNARALDASPAWARYVLAHELCHVRLWHETRSSTEPEADACAARAGFPRPVHRA